MDELKGKVAIVTGASKGIGAAIARQLGAAGAAVVVNYASSKMEADAVVADITRAGGKARAVQGDVTKAADIRQLLAVTKEAFGRLDILVNNAGVFAFGPLQSVTEADFHRQFDTNVLGTILTTKEAVDHFGPEGGSIINLSSIASLNPVPNSVVYAATKSAIDAVTKALAGELTGRKIRVNAIAPGSTATEGLAALGPEAQRQLASTIPMGRLGQPEEIARVALFLASDQSAWMTGERLTVSGGQH
ncbi:MAG: 3-oxoacyl-ACP reductase FabG [Devosia sp.]|nr:3-oxoacyl-ACP reductase FabG [Devosia sp.]